MVHHLFIRISSADDDIVKKTTLREVKLLRMLRNQPNIVHLHDAFRRRGKLYLVFEYVERNLLEVLEEHPDGLDAEMVRRLVFQLCMAIEWCHRNRVIHRDIKPENLLVNPADKTMKLCDFGFARTVSNKQTDLTDYVATRWYRAPELLLGSTKYDFSVDVWAIGCIMGELTDGQPLFPGKNEIDQLYIIQQAMGPLTSSHMELFLKSPRFRGLTFPAMSGRAIDHLRGKYAGLLPSDAVEFQRACLFMDPARRLTAAECILHPWFHGLPEEFGWEPAQPAASARASGAGPRAASGRRGPPAKGRAQSSAVPPAAAGRLHDRERHGHAPSPAAQPAPAAAVSATVPTAPAGAPAAAAAAEAGTGGGGAGAEAAAASSSCAPAGSGGGTGGVDDGGGAPVAAAAGGTGGGGGGSGATREGGTAPSAHAAAAAPIPGRRQRRVKGLAKQGKPKPGIASTGSSVEAPAVSRAGSPLSEDKEQEEEDSRSLLGSTHRSSLGIAVAAAASSAGSDGGASAAASKVGGRARVAERSSQHGRSGRDAASHNGSVRAGKRGSKGTKPARRSKSRQGGAAGAAGGDARGTWRHSLATRQSSGAGAGAGGAPAAGGGGAVSDDPFKGGAAGSGVAARALAREAAAAAAAGEEGRLRLALGSGAPAGAGMTAYRPMSGLRAAAAAEATQLEAAARVKASRLLGLGGYGGGGGGGHGREYGGGLGHQGPLRTPAQPLPPSLYRGQGLHQPGAHRAPAGHHRMPASLRPLGDGSRMRL